MNNKLWRQDGELRHFRDLMAAKLQKHEDGSALPALEDLKEGILRCGGEFGDAVYKLEDEIKHARGDMASIMQMRQEIADTAADTANYIFLVALRMCIHLDDLAQLALREVEG